MNANVTVNVKLNGTQHIVRCYLRLSENARAREALRQCLPETLRDKTFSNALKVGLNLLASGRLSVERGCVYDSARSKGEREIEAGRGRERERECV